jgi:hypothetical protein
MIVDGDGRFMSQRSTPLMSRFATEMIGEELRLLSPEGRSIAVPSEPSGEAIEVQIWQNTVSARPVSDQVDEWLTGALGVNCSLVALTTDSDRPVNPEFGQVGDQVSFADACPILVANRSSLQDLNRRLELPIGIERFRPNIVVDGYAAWEEDGWQRIRIGSVRFRVAKACGRCLVTTIDPSTGDTGIEPLKTLATFRKFGQSVTFGVYVIPDGSGTIRLGDVCLAD